MLIFEFICGIYIVACGVCHFLHHVQEASEGSPVNPLDLLFNLGIIVAGGMLMYKYF